MVDNARPEAEVKNEKSEIDVLSFSANPTKPPAIIRKKKITRGKDPTRLNFWRLSLSVSYGLVKTMFARE